MPHFCPNEEHDAHEFTLSLINQICYEEQLIAEKLLDIELKKQNSINNNQHKNGFNNNLNTITKEKLFETKPSSIVSNYKLTKPRFNSPFIGQIDTTVKCLECSFVKKIESI